MNTTLKFLALSLAAAVPAALAAETAGLALPSAFDVTTLVGAFAVTLVLLTAFADYARTARRHRYLAAASRATPRHAHPYAA